jgi:large subunit ribosomal protein L15
MALIRRVPKFGFTPHARVEYQAVNVARLQRLVDDGRIADGIVTPESLYALGVTSKRSQPVKILGDGDISASLNVTADKISAAARTKIEQAGGTVSITESSGKANE